jgi:hypothetical protein
MNKIQKDGYQISAEITFNDTLDDPDTLSKLNVTHLLDNDNPSNTYTVKLTVDGNSSIPPLPLTETNLKVELTLTKTYLILIKDLNTTYNNLYLEFTFAPQFINLLT